jgi:hypothetical protein
MHTPLLARVLRYAAHQADRDGIAPTPIAGLVAIRVNERSALTSQIARPLACLVLQGSKEVSTGGQTLTFHAGDSLLIMADVPTLSQITQASSRAPYCSLVRSKTPPARRYAARRPMRTWRIPPCA